MSNAKLITVQIKTIAYLTCRGWDNSYKI